MQVKKYEARTMNEALEMVKRDLGPDAIILSARDHRRKFGLVGDGSVEITAAVAEETLQKRRFAESRMKTDLREKFQNSPARVQREIMNDFVESYVQSGPSAGKSRTSAASSKNTGSNRSTSGSNSSASSSNMSAGPARAAAPAAAVRPPTNRRYIDIEDEGHIEAEDASLRIRDAAQRAWEALRDTDSRAAKAKKSTPSPEMIRQTLMADSKMAAAPVAQSGSQLVSQPISQPVSQSMPDVRAQSAQGGQSQNEIQSLKSELETLRSVLRDFQKVPQNFAGSHPGAEYGLTYDFSGSFEKLTVAGITPALAAEILQAAQTQLPAIKHKSRGLIDGFAAKYILDSTKVSATSKSRLHCFVGPRGSGKTSALVKMASHAVVGGQRKVALITADNQKVGALDQMRIYAQILNVPFGVVRRASDWRPLLEQLQGFDLVLCDFPGMSLKTIEDISLLKSLMPPEACEVHLSLSACAKDAELEETCRRFEASKYTDIIFNHLDEALVHGSIYNIMRKFDRPLHSFGVGPQVPEDFEAATKERVLDLIFRLTKFKRPTAE